MPESSPSVAHDPGDPACVEHVPGKVYNRALHVCRVCASGRVFVCDACRWMTVGTEDVQVRAHYIARGHQMRDVTDEIASTAESEHSP